jgi:hypothetical protein
MRLLIRSESEAFRLTVAIAVVGGVSVLVGYLIAPLAGVALFVAIAALALLWDLASIRAGRSALREAAKVGHQHTIADGRRRILLIAGEAVTGDKLSEQIVRDRSSRPVIDVVAPVLQSRTHFVTTDIDRETGAARRRLAQTLRWAAEHEIDATGVVGDPIAPFATIEDELRRYDFDEVILATCADRQGSWIEAEILDRAREELSLPVRQVVIDRDLPSAFTPIEPKERGFL